MVYIHTINPTRILAVPPHLVFLYIDDYSYITHEIKGLVVYDVLMLGKETKQEAVKMENCLVCNKSMTGLETFSFESGLICQNCYTEVLTLEQQALTESGNQSFIRLQRFLKKTQLQSDDCVEEVV